MQTLMLKRGYRLFRLRGFEKMYKVIGSWKSASGNVFYCILNRALRIINKRQIIAAFLLHCWRIIDDESNVHTSIFFIQFRFIQSLIEGQFLNIKALFLIRMIGQTFDQKAQQPKQELLLQTKTISTYLSQKAGMSQIDKKAIQAKIEAITKGTPKDLYDREMQAKRDQQIKKMMKQIPQYTQQQREDMKNTWNKKIRQFEKSRDLTKFWAHLDFDMFYAACQLLDKPHLQDKPCGVGSLGGVLATANYQARKYGVRSAMPTFIAIKICPDLVLLPTDFSKYNKYSKMFRQILSQFDPNLQSYGLDQAYVQITDFVKDLTYEQIDEFIRKIRTRIFQTTNLTVSCGVGANKMLAKMASQQKKPNDQFIIKNEAQQIRNYMKRKPLRKIPGIGTVNEYFFRGLNIENVQQLLNFIFIKCCQLLCCSSHWTRQQQALTVLQKVSKSVAKLQIDIRQILSLTKTKVTLFWSFISAEESWFSHNVVFSVQYSNFVKKDRNFNFIKYTSEENELFNACIKQIRNISQGVRNIGVRCSTIIEEKQLQKMSLQNFIKSKRQNDQASRDTAKQKSQVQKTKQMITQSIGYSKGKMLCPICSQMIDCKGNIMKFNRHIDKCLKQQSDREQTKSQPELGGRFNQTNRERKGKRKQKSKQQVNSLNHFLKKNSKKTIKQAYQ